MRIDSDDFVQVIVASIWITFLTFTAVSLLLGIPTIPAILQVHTCILLTLLLPGLLLFLESLDIVQSPLPHTSKKREALETGLRQLFCIRQRLD